MQKRHPNGTMATAVHHLTTRTICHASFHATNTLLAAMNCRQLTVGNFNIIYRIDKAAQDVHVVAVAYYRRLTDFAAERI